MDRKSTTYDAQESVFAFGRPPTKTPLRKTSKAPYMDKESVFRFDRPHAKTPLRKTSKAPYMDKESVFAFGRPLAKNSLRKTSKAPYMDKESVFAFAHSPNLRVTSRVSSAKSNVNTQYINPKPLENIPRVTRKTHTSDVIIPEPVSNIDSPRKTYNVKKSAMKKDVEDAKKPKIGKRNVTFGKDSVEYISPKNKGRKPRTKSVKKPSRKTEVNYYEKFRKINWF
jgi:hypothetical protein